MQRQGTRSILVVIGVLALGMTFLPGCRYILHRHGYRSALIPPGDQPDKILYEKAMNEIDHGRYDVGRLTLQTMINTYPDSEFLAKSKLAIADSYYREGSVSGLTQAEAEYKDFITFFPTAPEAPEAQYRVGMAHFRLMGKPDRDIAESRAAETEFREFLLKYPDSSLMPRVKARLREVQEVVAEADYRVAKFYYLKGSNLAARSRFQEIAEKYPNFSQADEALWDLGQTLERLRLSKAAAPYYTQIITNYPLSPWVGNAKERLTAMHVPIPKPTKAVLERAEADRLNLRRRGHRDLFSKLGGMVSSAPDVSATRHGPVILAPPKGGETEEAKTQAPTPGGATIAVTPVSDAALTSGKAVDPNASPNAGGSSGQADRTQGSTATKPPGNAPSNPQPQPDSNPNPPPQQQKKGKLHFLKRLKPF